MKQLVKLVSVFSITLIISGCTSMFYCTTPDVKEPNIDNSGKSDILSASKQCANNYLLMKKYAMGLKEANDVCK